MINVVSRSGIRYEDGAGAGTGSGAGAAHPEPMPEPVGTWFFERNAWAGRNLGIQSRSKGAVTETDAVVGS